MDLPITQRLPTEDDLNFILSSWIKSYRRSPSALSAFHHSPTATDDENEAQQTLYTRAHGKRVKEILASPPTLITIMCDPENPTTIYGYTVFSTKPNILHYVYVKKDFRQFGLATEMLTKVFNGQKTFHSSHRNENLKHLYKTFKIIFYPYL